MTVFLWVSLHSLTSLSWYSSTSLILWDMLCLQKTTGFRFILICFIVRFVEVRSSHRKYNSFASRGRCDNLDDIKNVENGGISRTIRTGNRFLLMSPIQYMKFSAPEVVHYLALKEEHDAREKCHGHLQDFTSTWLKRKVTFTIQIYLILTHTYIKGGKLRVSNVSCVCFYSSLNL